MIAIDKIFEKLSKGLPLSDLGLPLRNGRTDVSKVKIAKPREGRTLGFAGAELKRSGNIPELEGVSCSDLDFGGADLSDLLVFGSVFKNCVFDNCDCRNLGLWETSFEDCSFRCANLAGAVLGGVSSERPKPNAFHRVLFDGADFSSSVHYGEQYRHCSFRKSRLRRLDFDGSVFEDCASENAA